MSAEFEIVNPSDAFLVKISAAQRMLAEAQTIQDAISIADAAEAARVYAKRVGMGVPFINQAVAIKLQSERKAGEMLARMDKAKGGGDHKNKSTDSKALSVLGISLTQSSRWQRAATVPEEQFQQYIEASNGAGREITSAGLYKLANKIAPKNGARKPEPIEGMFTDLGELIAVSKKFGTIYADPPWRYQNQGTRASTSNHYSADMSVEDICAMPIHELCEDKCHLHLWTTNAFLFECPRIFAAWGFVFKSTFVWIKPQMGIGNYWRNAHEIMLLAVKGGQTALSQSETSWLQCQRGGHSAKPDEVRDRIVRLSPGPFLELFGRRPIPGWAVYGNQIKRTL